MHSSDRTLLASLGFADPDKKDRRHTLACQYLAQRSMIRKVAEFAMGPFYPPFTPTEEEIAAALNAGPPGPKPDWASSQFVRAKGELGPRWNQTDVRFTVGRVEVAIERGRGFVIGFWDVVAGGLAKRVVPYAVDSWEWNGQPKPRDFRADTEECAFDVKIEVKVRPVDVADLARQLELYRAAEAVMRRESDRLPDVVVAATCYPMSALDKATLAQKGIHHIRLGAPFEEWCKAQANVNPADGGQEF